MTSWSRPWLSETKLPERSSVHFTGRPSARAACSTQTYSGNGAAFMPNEPPTLPVKHAHLLGLDLEHVGHVGAHAEHALGAATCKVKRPPA